MSVIKNKRKKSEMDFFNFAIKLRKEMTDLLLRDFGVKNIKQRNLSMLYKTYKIRDYEDQALVAELCKKYKLDWSTDMKVYSKWFIERERDNILTLLENLLMNITMANSIYPTNEQEYYKRRNIQNIAIGNCYQLIQELQYVISILDIDANAYMPYVELIEREKTVLKAWRKSDNRFLRSIKKDSFETNSKGNSTGKNMKKVSHITNNDGINIVYGKKAYNQQKAEEAEKQKAKAAKQKKKYSPTKWGKQDIDAFKPRSRTKVVSDNVEKTSNSGGNKKDK